MIWWELMFSTWLKSFFKIIKGCEWIQHCCIFYICIQKAVMCVKDNQSHRKSEASRKQKGHWKVLSLTKKGMTSSHETYILFHKFISKFNILGTLSSFSNLSKNSNEKKVICIFGWAENLWILKFIGSHIACWNT